MKCKLNIKSMIEHYIGNGQYHSYLSISELQLLTNHIKEVCDTPNYFKITPFYINQRIDRQIEFEDIMFYVEFMNNFDNERIEKHIGECFGENYESLNEDEKRLGHIMFPLCKTNDIISFHNVVQNYLDFLFEVIPKIMSDKIMKLIDKEDIGFGNSCFEIHSR